MEHIKKNINIYVKIAIIIAFAIIIFNINECHMYKDDEVYAKVFNNFSTFKTWAGEFYNTWSGRIITSALSNIFLRMPLIIFRICNTAVYIMAIMAISKITNTSNRNVLLASMIIISFLIDFQVIEQGMIWVVGAFNYLWPTAFMCVALIPFVKSINQSKENNLWFILYILADLVACFAEQTALVLLCFGIIAILYKITNKQKIEKLLLIHFIIISILTAIELLAPGNFVRAQASILRRYPTFDMLNMGDKILQGIIVLANQMLGSDIILMLILTFFIAINKNNKIISKIPFIYFLCSFIGNKIGFGEGVLYGLKLFGKEYIYGITIYIPILIFVINIILITVLIFFSTKEKNNGFLTTIIFLASIGAALSVSFSPTIYASGARIFFTTDFLILIVIQNLVNIVIVTKEKGLKNCTSSVKIE